MSVAQLAAAATVDAGALAAFESGHGSLSTAKLDRLATVLGLDAMALLDGRAVQRPNATAFFRHAGVRDFHDEDTAALVAALEAGRALLEVTAVLPGAAESLRHQFGPCVVGPVPYEDGYAAARRVRLAARDTVGPILNLRGFLEEAFDVAVCGAALKSHQLLAVTVKDVVGAASVLVNTAVPISPASLRVTLAHELGHALLDPPRSDVECVVDIDLDNEHRPVDESEQRARAFAAELLMPLLGLRKEFGDARQVDVESSALQLVEAARDLFMTPNELAVNHLMNHGYVLRDDDFRREIVATLRSHPKMLELQAKTSTAEELVELGQSRALLDRVRKAHELMLITDGRARELLRLSVVDPLPWASTNV